MSNSLVLNGLKIIFDSAWFPAATTNLDNATDVTCANCIHAESAFIQIAKTVARILADKFELAMASRASSIASLRRIESESAPDSGIGFEYR
jgi:hypothetical protein